MEVDQEELQKEKKEQRSMRLFWDWKITLSSLFLISTINLSAQDGPSPIENFKDKKVFYTDLGFNASPFRIKYPYTEETDVLKFKNNFKTIMGLGFAYKWFHLRIAFPVFGFVKPVNRWGESQQFQLGFNFSLKKLFFDVDFKTVRGYALQNYGDLDFSFNNSITNHRITESLGVTNLSFNAWYFHNKAFKMSALRGKQAHYKEAVQTWYLKSTLNGFGVDNDGKGLIPPFLIDNTSSKTEASTYSAIDLGVIPGYAYVTRYNHWQISGWLGLGAVIQSKFYTQNNTTRGFIGLAPRYDIRFIGGYTNDHYFVFLDTEFDNKSVAFNELKYRQYFYSIRISAGVRFGKPKRA
jgi:hypothetical protein